MKKRNLKFSLAFLLTIGLFSSGHANVFTIIRGGGEAPSVFTRTICAADRIIGGFAFRKLPDPSARLNDVMQLYSNMNQHGLVWDWKELSYMAPEKREPILLDRLMNFLTVENLGPLEILHRYAGAYPAFEPYVNKLVNRTQDRTVKWDARSSLVNHKDGEILISLETFFGKVPAHEVYRLLAHQTAHSTPFQLINPKSYGSKSRFVEDATTLLRSRELVALREELDAVENLVRLKLAKPEDLLSKDKLNLRRVRQSRFLKGPAKALRENEVFEAYLRRFHVPLWERQLGQEWDRAQGIQRLSE